MTCLNMLHVHMQQQYKMQADASTMSQTEMWKDVDKTNMHICFTCMLMRSQENSCTREHDYMQYYAACMGLCIQKRSKVAQSKTYTAIALFGRTSTAY